MVRLTNVQLPAFGVEQSFPEIPLEVCQARMESATRRLCDAGLNCLVVYGDREHFANLAYLTGFDPELRARIADRFPGCWQRMQARRRFMTELLAISLHESVLPLSNTSGWLPPFALAPESVLARL